MRLHYIDKNKIAEHINKNNLQMDSSPKFAAKIKEYQKKILENIFMTLELGNISLRKREHPVGK